jgi:hypothetical protein
MAATAQSAIAVIGIDIGKNSFHVVGLDGRGVIVFPKGIRNGKTSTPRGWRGFQDMFRVDGRCLSWAKLGPGAMSAQCPGYPR